MKNVLDFILFGLIRDENETPETYVILWLSRLAFMGAIACILALLLI